MLPASQSSWSLRAARGNSYIDENLSALARMHEKVLASNDPERWAASLGNTFEGTRLIMQVISREAKEVLENAAQYAERRNRPLAPWTKKRLRKDIEALGRGELGREFKGPRSWSASDVEAVFNLAVFRGVSNQTLDRAQRFALADKIQDPDIRQLVAYSMDVELYSRLALESLDEKGAVRLELESASTQTMFATLCTVADTFVYTEAKALAKAGSRPEVLMETARRCMSAKAGAFTLLQSGLEPAVLSRDPRWSSTIGVLAAKRSFSSASRDDQDHAPSISDDGEDPSISDRQPEMSRSLGIGPQDM